MKNSLPACLFIIKFDPFDLDPALSEHLCFIRTWVRLSSALIVASMAALIDNVSTAAWNQCRRGKRSKRRLTRPGENNERVKEGHCARVYRGTGSFARARACRWLHARGPASPTSILFFVCKTI